MYMLVIVIWECWGCVLCVFIECSEDRVFLFDKQCEMQVVVFCDLVLILDVDYLLFFCVFEVFVKVMFDIGGWFMVC